MAALPAAEEPVYDSHGIRYAAIDAEPTLGTIKAYNRGYNFLVAQFSRAGFRAVAAGEYVALRRDGVIVCFAFVESVGPGQVGTLKLLRGGTGVHPITMPAIEDEVIRIP